MVEEKRQITSLDRIHAVQDAANWIDSYFDMLIVQARATPAEKTRSMEDLEAAKASLMWMHENDAEVRTLARSIVQRKRNAA